MIKFGATIKSFGKVSKQSLLFISFVLCVPDSFCRNLQLNELEYFEAPGLNVFVFSNQYTGLFFDEKTAGIELIHHGVRTATGGAVRLQHTPEQWDQIPTVVDRKIGATSDSIEVKLRYGDYDFDTSVIVTAQGDGVTISVYLDQPLPQKLEGHAGFNLEFLPAAYFEKTYLADGAPGIFPLYPSSRTTAQPVDQKIPQFAGHTTFDDRGKGVFLVPEPLATGKTIILAPEDPERHVTLRSADAPIMLFDGRNLAQNGWFIVRSLISAKKSGKVLEWQLQANTIPDWKRAPLIGFSQVGYHPAQKKLAIIELDKNDAPLKSASLFQVPVEGKASEKLTGEIKQWGKYLRYNYVTFDFSSIKDTGLYFVQYGDQKTNAFPIGPRVYEETWHPTLDVWFPVQMDHMLVNEAYRVWHGVSFLDDALQAPVNHEHFDGYRMGENTDTKFKPLERIPGLAVGGWFDAGDFDIQTGTHCRTILHLVAAWEEFGLDRDQTYIDQDARYVDIHRPDGKPDLLQQIEHGTINLVAQINNIGHPVRGIVVPNLHQYHHLGDAVMETDNLPFNPNLKPYETDGKSSGTRDDRWAFTTRLPFLDYQAVGTLCAASRALKDYNPPFAEECLSLAIKLWEEQSSRKDNDEFETGGFGRRFRGRPEMPALLQLYITTKEPEYAERFKELLWPALDRSAARSISDALLAVPHMDAAYKSKLKEYVVKYKDYLEELTEENPYGVPMRRGGWGGNGNIIGWAIDNYYANKYFPEIVEPEYIYKGLNYIFGCHPYSNVSFVSAVGARSKKIAYGNNRADYSFIAGGVVPGLILLQPDFPENKEDWPFLWGENEYVLGTCASYIFLSNAVNELAGKQ